MQRYKQFSRLAPCESQGFFQFFEHLINDGTGKRSPDHSHGARYEFRLIQIWVAAAIGRTVLVHAAEVVFQERAGGGACRPRRLAAPFGGFEICLDELFTRHREAARQSLDFLFAEFWLDLPAAVGALGAVNSGPHAPGDSKDTSVNFILIEIAFGLQVLPKSPILVFFCLCLGAYLNQIESHICALN